MEFRVDKKIVEMIGAFSDAFGPSGFEDGTNEVGRSYAPDWCDVREDNIRNLYMTPRRTPCSR